MNSLCFVVLIILIILYLFLGRARDALKLCLPEALKDQSFGQIIRSEEFVQRWLVQLLKNLSEKSPFESNAPNVPNGSFSNPPPPVAPPQPALAPQTGSSTTGATQPTSLLSNNSLATYTTNPNLSTSKANGSSIQNRPNVNSGTSSSW